MFSTVFNYIATKIKQELVYFILSLLLSLLLNNGSEALGNELILKLTHLTGSNLTHHLLAGGLSPLLEFAHIFTVTLTLLLLCVYTACLK